MRYRKLGSSDLNVSEVCLGTMTWGEQNTQADADAQIEYALDQGVNFFDTAEMYSVPPKPETQGNSERVLGDWISRNRSRRDELIVATKIVGPGISWIRNAEPINGKNIKLAIDDSLKRLQIDTIDLYQLHWPNRTSPHFAKHWPGMVDHSLVDVVAHRESFLEILSALDDCVKAGKIKHCGLSDDTPWGIKEYLNLAEKHDLPKMVSIQNEFSLLHLKDSPFLIESCVLDDVAYLPWSPLAGGALSGKYRGGKVPKGSRWSMSARNGLFRDTPQVHAMVEALADVAEKHQLTLTQLSLGWVYQFPGVTSNIIGATTDIDTVIRQYPAPF